MDWTFGLAGSLIAKLKFPKILHEIEQNNTASTLTQLSLPRIVVIGDEKAGKSSTLERIAMVDVLPRDSKICTRQPIVLKLRYDKERQTSEPEITLTFPSEEPQGGMTAEQVREKIDEHMRKIGIAQQGIVMGKEIEVEVRSNGVPTIDLVDLPGLIAVRVNDASEPDTISELTEQCTKQYLDDPNTGAVVCVLDATQDNLRTSRALRLVQSARPDLQAHSMGVLAKADKTYDRDFEEEGKPHAYWKLEERLRGTSEDMVELSCGFFAVKNRNTRTQAGTNTSLQDHNSHELQWFSETGLDKIEEVLPRIGIDSVVERVDWVFHKFLGQKYVPNRLQEQQASRDECESQLQNLGTAPSEMEASAIVAAVQERLLAAFIPKHIEDICTSAMGQLPNDGAGQDTRYKRITVARRLRKQYEELLVTGGPLVEGVSQRVAETVDKCFDEHVELPMRLCRFSGLRDKVRDAAKEGIQWHSKAFVAKANHVVGTILDISCGRAVETGPLREAVGDCIMDHLMSPIVVEDGLLPFFEMYKPDVVDTPEEACAEEREQLLQRRRQIDISITALQRIRDM